MLTIVADMREQRCGICRDLASREDVSLSYRDLEAADFIVGEGVGVERKEAVDFVNSLIRDKRLFEQVRYLKSSFDRAIIMIEGDIFATRSKIHPNALVGALSYLVALENIQIIPVPSVRHSAQMIYTLAKHLQTGLGYEIPLRGAKPKAPDTACQFLLEGLPGVGPLAAARLLEHFGSPREVFAATQKDLTEVSGLGKKTAERISLVLDHKKES
ncbi:ERCC4 domain-containing protein [Geoalkalibacter subterraneus]|uniref:ERCC4 domain-containing protein n=1 Tax=Geoalkalibacter subterraneus TaxID=483547 RepID=UPI000694CEC9|nr:ERCC4 domain-containing protein [Geoalkalibacter subterraneus]